MTNGRRGVEPCTVDGCDRLIFAKDWCKKHYDRNNKYGSPLAKHAPGRVDPTVCRRDGCTRPLQYRQEHYCATHYIEHVSVEKEAKARLKTLTPTNSSEDYFWERVDRRGEDECWNWKGTVHRHPDRPNSLGYGRITTREKSYLAHRFSYALAHPDLLPYAPVHHKCANTLCVNPEHLQAITPQENTAEMLERQWYLKRIADLEAQLAACKCG